MGSAQIQAGKAYVAIYGDNKPLVEAMKQLSPSIRKQGEALAKIGEATASTFAKGNAEIEATSRQADRAQISLVAMATAGQSVSTAAQSAMIATAESSKRTAGGVETIVARMNEVKPATKGFASAFAQLKTADVTLANGAFGVSSLITLLKGGGPAAKPLLDMMTGILGKAEKIKAIKPGATKSPFDLGALASPSAVPGSSGGSSSSGGLETVRGIADKLKQTYNRIYGLIQSRGISPANVSGGTKLYDQEAIDALAKAIKDLDDKKKGQGGNSGAMRAATAVASRLHAKIVDASSGKTANMLGLQSAYEVITTGGKKAIDSIRNSERAMYALGAAGGVAAGVVDGAWKTLVNGGKAATVVAVNVAGGLAGVKGAFAPVFGQMTALQRVANSAQWASLFFGSRTQRKVAKQMGLEADAAAIGEAFARGWVPGFLKYARLGIPRAITSTIRGVASVPGSIIGGIGGLVFGRHGTSGDVDDLGNTAARVAPKLGLLQRGIDNASAAARSGSGFFRSLTSNAGGILAGGLGILASIARLSGNGNENARSRIDAVGSSASSQRRSVQSTSELAFGAEATGSSLKTLDSGMNHFRDTVKKANEGNETATEQLNKLGLSAEKLSAMNTDQTMKRLGQALAGIKDPAERDRMAIAALGESGAELVPLLMDLDAYRVKAKASGAIISQADVEASKKMALAMSQLKAVLSSAWNRIGTASIQGTTQWIQGAAKFIEKNQAILTGLLKIVAAIGAAAGAFVLWEHFGGPVLAVVRSIGIATLGLLSPLGLVTLAIGAGVVAWMRFTKSGRDAASYLGKIFKQFYEYFMDLWGGVIAAVKKGELGLAWQITVAGMRLTFFEFVQGIGVSWNALLRLMFTGQKLLADSWAFVWSKMVDGFLGAAKIIANGLERLLQMIPGVPREFKIAVWGAQAGINILDGEAEKNRQKALQANEAAMQKQIAALPKDDQARINQLRQELALLQAQARKMEVDPQKKPAAFNPDQIGAGAMKDGGQAGTFSAIAAVGLGGGAVLDKIAANTKRTFEEIEKAAKIKGKRLVFGNGVGF